MPLIRKGIRVREQRFVVLPLPLPTTAGCSHGKPQQDRSNIAGLTVEPSIPMRAMRTIGSRRHRRTKKRILATFQLSSGTRLFYLPVLEFRHKIPRRSRML
jgi:hypothetical protein